jgi:hypothetical protein
MSIDQIWSEIQADQANAWHKTYALCDELGAPSQPSGWLTVERFILDLHERAEKYDKLIALIGQIANGEVVEPVNVSEMDMDGEL